MKKINVKAKTKKIKSNSLKLFKIFAITLCTVAVIFAVISFTGKEKESYPVRVCLDAGHGGEDSGSVSGDRKEKDDNLKIVLEVQKKLEKKNIDTYLTRSDDTFIELEDRCDTANDSKANLFVSFHRNGSDGNGVEIWIGSDDDWADRVMAQNILSSLEEVGISQNRGIKAGYARENGADYYVNDKTQMPSCLIELGFMSSKKDNELFDENLEEYAKAIADAIEITLEDLSRE